MHASDWNTRRWTTRIIAVSLAAMSALAAALTAEAPIYFAESHGQEDGLIDGNAFICTATTIHQIAPSVTRTARTAPTSTASRRWKRCSRRTRPSCP